MSDAHRLQCRWPGNDQCPGSRHRDELFERRGTPDQPGGECCRGQQAGAAAQAVDELLAAAEALGQRDERGAQHQ